MEASYNNFKTKYSLQTVRFNEHLHTNVIKFNKIEALNIGQRHEIAICEGREEQNQGIPHMNLATGNHKKLAWRQDLINDTMWRNFSNFNYIKFLKNHASNLKIKIYLWIFLTIFNETLFHVW